MSNIIAILEPELKLELDDARLKRQIFRTETEARISVLNELAFSTRAAKYWQCVREQCVMSEQLELLSFEHRKNEIAIQRLSRLMLALTDDLEMQDAQVRLDENLFRRDQIASIAADRMREIAMWSKLKKEFDDGSFDTQNCNTHQLASYTDLWIKQAKFQTKSGQELINLAGQLASALSMQKEILPELTQCGKTAQEIKKMH